MNEQRGTPSSTEQEIALHKTRLDELSAEIRLLQRQLPQRNLEVIEFKKNGAGEQQLYAKYSDTLTANGAYEGVLYEFGSGNDLLVDDWADTDLGASGNDIITILNLHEIDNDTHPMTSTEFGTPPDIPYPVYRTGIKYPDDDTTVYVGWHVRVGGCAEE